MMSMKKTLPGFDGFHMIGQWTTPGGGLPPPSPPVVTSWRCSEKQFTYVVFRTSSR
jgi:hypothetical protein